MTGPDGVDPAGAAPARRRRRALLGVTALIVLSIGTAIVVLASRETGDASTTVRSQGRTTGEEDVGALLGSRGLRSCGEVPVIEAPADQYRDRPSYELGEAPLGAVRSWAEGKPGFQGLWTDEDHHGWITVAFDRAVEERRREVRSDFPDDGVVAVEVDWTVQELEVTQSRVTAALHAAGTTNWSAGPDLPTGVVQVSVGVLRSAVLDVLEPFSDDPICVIGIPESESVPDGPQPAGGDSWRLLADQKVGASYRTGVATMPAQYERLWHHVGLRGERPAVDFEREVVVWFGAVYGSGCEIRLDDVVLEPDPQRPLLHASIVVPSDPVACNDDANPRAYLVALERGALPSGPFAIQLQADDPPDGVPEERTVVDADLQPPGAVAPDEAIGPDPDLIGGSG